MPLASPHFAALLKHHRFERGWSQLRASLECGFDSSTVSRLEARRRGPTIEAVGRLCAGFALAPDDADRLRLAAGFAPLDPAGAIADQPALAYLYRLVAADRDPALRLHAQRVVTDLAALLQVLETRRDTGADGQPPIA